MEHDEDGSSFGDGSDFAGAIFMCNTATRQECFRRRLFGLPSNMAGLVRNIRAGMFLFLFDHEERKLYGVFEAITDGAINIVPGAYSGFGSFPAQVRFRNLWNCRPLFEDEFKVAIQDNYFTPNKFNFNLSYKQVVELVRLFSLKKIGSSNRSGHTSHDKANSRLDNSGVTKRARSVRFDTLKHSEENDVDLRSGYSAKSSMYYQNRDLAYKDPDDGNEHGSYQIVPGVIRRKPPNLRSSPSQFDPMVQESIPVGTLRRPFHHIDSELEREHSYDVLEAIKPNLSRSLARPNHRSHFCPLHVDSHGFDYLATDYHSPELTETFTEPLLPHDPYPMQSSYEKFYLPPSNNSGIVPRINGGLPIPKDSLIDMTKYVGYRSSPEFYNSDLVPPLHGSRNCFGCREASLEVDNARHPRYWKLLPDDRRVSLAKNENLVTSEEPQLSSRYPSDPCSSDGYYDRERNYYCSQGSEEYLKSASSEIRDTSERKTSVFSRLSKPQKSNVQKDKGSDSNTNSLDLLRLLSQRKNQWYKMKRTPKKSFSRDNGIENKRLMNSDRKETIASDSLIVLDGDRKAAEERIETPFLNFKRRSEVKMEEGEIRDNVLVEGVKEKCKRRKLIRPSLTESGAFTSNFVVTNAEKYEFKQLPVLEASILDEKHVNPKDSAEGPAVSGKDGAGTLLTSKGNGTDVVTADTKAENFSVESYVECSKTSTSELRVVGNGCLHLDKFEKKKKNASDSENEKGPDGNSQRRSVDCHVKFDSHKTEGIGECNKKAFNDISRKNETFHRNSEVPLISVSNAEAVEVAEQDASRADLSSECDKLDVVYEKVRSHFNHKKEKTCVVYSSNSSQTYENADCAKEDANTLQSDLKSDNDKSNEFGQKTDLLSMKSDSGVVGDFSLLITEHKCTSDKSDAVIKNEDSLSDGNDLKIRDSDSAQEMEEKIILTSDINDFLTKKDDTPTGNTKIHSFWSRTKLTELSFLKCKAEEIKESRILTSDIAKPRRDL